MLDLCATGCRLWIQKSKGVGEREIYLGAGTVRMAFMKELVVGRNLKNVVKF